VLEKIEIIRQYSPFVKIEADGGIGETDAQRCIRSGADVIVTGTAFFRAQNPQKFVQQIESE
jgi:pentose-5-phosphate-3-epimerase